MKDILKLALQIFIVGAVLLGLTFGGIALYKQLFKAEGLKGSVVSDPISLTTSSTLSTLSGTEYEGSSEAKPAILGTSTTAWMEDPISRTIQIGDDADQFCMNIWWSPSTTDAVLKATFFASQDGTNWYAVDGANGAATTSEAFNSATSTYTIFGVISADGLRMKHTCPSVLANLNAKYLKVEFSREDNLSGGKLFVEGWTKTDY